MRLTVNSLTRSVFRWVWPHLGQTDTTLLPGVANEVLCDPLFTLPISQSRARETYWPHWSLCGRKLSNPMPVLFKRLNSGWLWPRRLAVRPWGGWGGPGLQACILRRLGSKRATPPLPSPSETWQGAETSETSRTWCNSTRAAFHFCVDSGRKHRGVTYRPSFISKHFQKGQKGEQEEGRSTRDSRETVWLVASVSYSSIITASWIF